MNTRNWAILLRSWCRLSPSVPSTCFSRLVISRWAASNTNRRDSSPVSHGHGITLAGLTSMFCFSSGQ